MAMPFCDNFWQAQASVMLTPRLPLYIVEMYACLMYLSTSAARRYAGLGPVARACVAGLFAHCFYGVYDVCGPRFLWWPVAVPRNTPDCNESAALHSYGLDAHCR